MRDCRVGHVNEVGEEPQALGEVEYVGWGGVIGNIEWIDTEEKNWEPFEKQEIIVGNIDEVGGLEPTWRTPTSSKW